MRVSGDPTSPNPPTITVLPGPTSAAASSTEMTLLLTRPLDRLSMRGTFTTARRSSSPALRLPPARPPSTPLLPVILSDHDKYVQYPLLTDSDIKSAKEADEETHEYLVQRDLRRPTGCGERDLRQPGRGRGPRARVVARKRAPRSPLLREANAPPHPEHARRARAAGHFLCRGTQRR